MASRPLNYSDPFTSPHHKLARLATRGGKRLAAGLASPSWWREAFAPRAPEVVPAPPALTAETVKYLTRLGYTWEVDADRNRLIARAGPKYHGIHQTRVYSLDRVPLSAFADQLSLAGQLSHIYE